MENGAHDDPSMGNLQIGAQFENSENLRGHHSPENPNRRMHTSEVECLDMEVVIGEQKYVITIFPDSDPHALAQEFAAQQNLPQELVAQLSEQIQANLLDNFGQE